MSLLLKARTLKRTLLEFKNYTKEAIIRKEYVLSVINSVENQATVYNDRGLTHQGYDEEYTWMEIGSKPNIFTHSSDGWLTSAENMVLNEGQLINSSLHQRDVLCVVQ